MKKMKLLGLSLAVMTTLGFSGCGGDSGSEENNSLTSGSNNNDFFPKNAISSEPTIENGKEVKEVVSQNQESAYAINAVNTSKTQNIALTIKKINNIIKKIDTNYYSLNETINETESCLDGGTYNYSGSGSETGGFSITTTFNNCNEDDILLNGKILTSASDYDSTFDDYKTIEMTMLSDLSIEVTGLLNTLYSGSATKIEYSNITDLYEASTMKMSISAISEFNGVKTGQQDSVYYFDLSSFLNTSMYQTSGKVYINNLTSYVTYDNTYDMSQTPFTFNYLGGLNSGEARYHMANGSKLKILVEAGEAKTYIDANSDGIYELSE